MAGAWLTLTLEAVPSIFGADEPVVLGFATSRVGAPGMEFAAPALGADSSRVPCVVNLAGDMDLKIPFPEVFRNAKAATFFGDILGEVPAAYRHASPFHHIDDQTVPSLILQEALGDSAVEHSRRMTEALHEAGVEVVYGEFPDIDHIAVIDWALMGPLTLAFLGRPLGPVA